MLARLGSQTVDGSHQIDVLQEETRNRLCDFNSLTAFRKINHLLFINTDVALQVTKPTGRYYRKLRNKSPHMFAVTTECVIKHPTCLQ